MPPTLVGKNRVVFLRISSSDLAVDAGSARPFRDSTEG